MTFSGIDLRIGVSTNPWTDRIRADALAAELARPGLDHADHAELRRRIVGLAEVAVQTDDRRGVQDAARMLLEHDVHDRLRAVVDAFEVDVDDPLELVVGHFPECASCTIPALLTSVSIRPHAAITPSTIRAMLPLLGHVDVERARGATRSVMTGHSLRVGEVDVADRDLSASMANLMAVASPMPEAEPVMIATLSLKRMDDCLFGSEAKPIQSTRRASHKGELIHQDLENQRVAQPARSGRFPMQQHELQCFGPSNRSGSGRNTARIRGGSVAVDRNRTAGCARRRV